MTNIQWSKKYEPKRLDDIIADKTLISNLLNVVDEPKNIIITGPTGVGKSTAANCIASETRKKSKGERMVLKLSILEDRSVKAIQSRVQTFCKQKVTSNDTKLIVIDNADSIIGNAQRAISDIIDNHNNAKFIFLCNNLHCVVEVVQSKCLIFKMTALEEESIVKRLMFIAEAEQVEYDNPAIEKIAKSSKGDLRSAINTLQFMHNSLGKLNVKNVVELSGEPNVAQIMEIVKFCKAHDLGGALGCLQNSVNQGYSPLDISTNMFDALKIATTTDDATILIDYMNEVCQTIMAVSKGTTYLQLAGCIAKMSDIDSKKLTLSTKE